MEILEFTSKEAAAPLMSLAAPLWYWKFWKKNSRFGNFFSEILKIMKILIWNFQSRKQILTLRGVYRLEIKWTFFFHHLFSRGFSSLELSVYVLSTKSSYRVNLPILCKAFHKVVVRWQNHQCNAFSPPCQRQSWRWEIWTTDGSDASRTFHHPWHTIQSQAEVWEISATPCIESLERT